MPRDRDVAAFAERAEGCDEGWRGRLHHEISDRTAQLALAQVPAPRRVLDVGCGTGYLLRQLAARTPDAVELAGLDAAAEMVLVDQFSPLYLPTLIGSRRGKARTRRRASRLLARAGFRSPEWHALYAVIIGAVTASK